MKKYLIFVVVIILSLVVLTSGCVNNDETNETKSFSGNGISFVYNGTWNTANTTAPNAIVAVGDPTTVDAQNNPTTFVLIQKPNETVDNNLEATYTQNYASFFNNTTNQRVSEANITINSNQALENVYMTNSGGLQIQMRAVWIIQNGTIYVILCGTIPSKFEAEQKNFDLIINSFTVQ
ncbi:MAG TPA: PsbP-related protein [Methanobacterium sp.]